MQAGNAAASFMGLRPVARVLPSEPDEPQIIAAKDVLRTQRQLARLASSGVAAVLSGRRGGWSSSRSPAAGMGPELLREDDALQTLLRDEVQQLGAATLAGHHSRHVQAASAQQEASGS